MKLVAFRRKGFLAMFSDGGVAIAVHFSIIFIVQGYPSIEILKHSAPDKISKIALSPLLLTIGWWL